ncbi:hypothetical protein FVQ98_14100 [Ottowia sp. GY511]|uniref:Uncharacterized protein n=1 Tax=Ottowia flava TaxID=2675430 RepID=A0ABW4KU67_9BURK|nr:hypothetical protein [Ottowia sp. GY511]TXK26505.1 hypothetical protein FVQ98_14100 [Ottowia sp. GY511]
MTNDQAKTVLALLCGWGRGDPPSQLSCLDPFVDSEWRPPFEILLDGVFTADQLEAMAMWLRDPKAITGARVTKTGDNLAGDNPPS